MTSDKARKRDIRRRMQETDESYTEAARRVDEENAPPVLAKEVPAATLTAPVATRLARHLVAARQHLGQATRLAHEHGAAAFAPSDHLRDRPGGPLTEIAEAASSDVWQLVGWAERTALASGAVPALPNPFGNGTPEQRQAYEILYPDQHTWCASPGGTLPAPGEKPGQADTGRTTTHSLPGPVPEARLSLRASGRSVVRAKDVVPGTPAAALWDAAEDLETYACDWMSRGGDSPADLAAALDGLAEVADRLQGAIRAVGGEIARRYERQSLTGGHREEVAVEAGHADEAARTLRRHLEGLRKALTGATAVLPPATPGTVPPHVSAPLDGATLARVREALGDEVFAQRHITKTMPGDERRTAALERIVQWMHARGASVYDAPAHAKTDPATRLGQDTR
ncbi:hypothetical protein [Streptosporangium jomthongense]|uniref:DUF4439 domain-containing protein n=1 Tax=Streptosporangium jomthongense TaxID=1193683 RepID=A0ABV8FCK3_9ACTN